jgi:hypothetical protein
MHLNLPIYDTCAETEGGFCSLAHFLKKTSFFFQNSAPFGQETTFENDDKNSQFHSKFVASPSSPPCSVCLHTSSRKMDQMGRLEMSV